MHLGSRILLEDRLLCSSEEVTFSSTPKMASDARNVIKPCFYCGILWIANFFFYFTNKRFFVDASDIPQKGKCNVLKKKKDFSNLNISKTFDEDHNVH